VLKGIFPVVLGGAALQWAYLEYKWRALRKFHNLPPNVVMRKIHNFYWEGGRLQLRTARVGRGGAGCWLGLWGHH